MKTTKEALSRAIEEGESSGYLELFDFDSHLQQLSIPKNLRSAMGGRLTEDEIDSDEQ